MLPGCTHISEHRLSVSSRKEARQQFSHWTFSAVLGNELGRLLKLSRIWNTLLRKLRCTDAPSDLQNENLPCPRQGGLTPNSLADCSLLSQLGEAPAFCCSFSFLLMPWCYYSFCEYRGLLPVPLLPWMTSISLWQYSSLERDLSARVQSVLPGFMVKFSSLQLFPKFFKNWFLDWLVFYTRSSVGRVAGKTIPTGPPTCQSVSWRSTQVDSICLCYIGEPWTPVLQVLSPEQQPFFNCMRTSDGAPWYVLSWALCGFYQSQVWKSCPRMMSASCIVSPVPNTWMNMLSEVQLEVAISTICIRHPKRIWQASHIGQSRIFSLSKSTTISPPPAAHLGCVSLDRKARVFLPPLIYVFFYTFISIVLLSGL